MNDLFQFYVYRSSRSFYSEQKKTCVVAVSEKRTDQKGDKTAVK